MISPEAPTRTVWQEITHPGPLTEPELQGSYGDFVGQNTKRKQKCLLFYYLNIRACPLNPDKSSASLWRCPAGLPLRPRLSRSGPCGWNRGSYAQWFSKRGSGPAAPLGLVRQVGSLASPQGHRIRQAGSGAGPAGSTNPPCSSGACSSLRTTSPWCLST